MKTALRVLLGAVLGTLVLWLSVSAYGLLAVWSPWSVEWWKHHYEVVSVTSKALAFAPGLIILGVIFASLFKARAVLWSLVAMLLVLLVAYADTLLHPEQIGPTLRITWSLFVPFLIGPPLIVYFVSRLRSNNRWRVP